MNSDRRSPSEDLLFALSGDGRVMLANDAAARLIGRQPDELRGQDWLQFTPSAEHADARQALAEAEISTVQREFSLQTTDGVRTIVWTLAPLRGAEDTAIAVVLTGRIVLEEDDAARRGAEAMASLAQFKYALDEAAIVAITDQRGLITYANDKFCQISKYLRGELLGQDHRLINSAHHPKEFIRDLWRTIAQGRVWRGEIRNRAKDGELYWVDTTIVPLLDGSGRPRQYLAIRSDITQRKLAEAKLREQEALAKLGELAAIVAHEVRNPLAGLRGSLQILSARLPSDMRERHIVGAMLERIDALNDRVRDILMYAGANQPKLQAVPLAPLIADVAAAARAAARQGISIEATGDACIAWADLEMTREILLNIIINACQASPPDGVVMVAAEAATDLCAVTVLDRGPGIPSENRGRIFEPFFTTKRGGTGLGLAIVKRLVDLQGGSIALTDRPDGGTACRITLHRFSGHRG